MSDNEDDPSIGQSLMRAWDIVSWPQTILMAGTAVIGVPTLLVVLIYEMVLDDPVFGGGAVILVVVLSLSLTGALVWNNWAKKRRWAALAEEDEEPRRERGRRRPRARRD